LTYYYVFKLKAKLDWKQFIDLLISEDIEYISQVCFKIVANVLALGAVADFGAQNCQYTTKVDAR
jgi:hypothetical protein